MSVSLMTIVKSAGPMFALLWAFGLGLEPLSIKLVAIVIVSEGGARDRHIGLKRIVLVVDPELHRATHAAGGATA